MPDRAFDDPRLAALYDPLDPDRSDLEPYAAILTELGARSVLDVGCGTGTFAALLADRGLEVIGVDPAEASVEIARTKSDAVTWLVTDATRLPPLDVDAATMTANVAQVFVTDEDWLATLRGIREALRAGGHLVFESRVPERRAWLEWDRAHTWDRTEVPGVGGVESWRELIGARDDLVSFRSTFVLEDTVVLTSDSTLRFRSREQIESSLADTGFTVIEVRDAPDRPGREYVFVARRAD
ncbi:class I SAM-dependent methyltransferase [Marmoricola sp. URHB0036]|uniref:class I SAM-dependent DNA methyltransferase n=1 Tax=Marmoricola sp. URHB0036 TaxID=1298863 RepID=UPI000400DC51|nr:class I SAM-dependent methyltransferase [Marmoricola sp. URHB0036]